MAKENYFSKIMQSQYKKDFNRRKAVILANLRPICLDTGMINPIKLDISSSTLNKLNKE